MKMTVAEREAFLAGLHVGVVSVSPGDGGPPLSSPLWYSYRPGGTVNILTESSSRKARAIAAAGRFSLCVQDEQPPYRYVTVDGPASIEAAGLAERVEIVSRYLGARDGEAWVSANPDMDDIVIRLTPEHWFTADFGKPRP
jgi:PPOX class probable F420-dependent enzyme